MVMHQTISGPAVAALRSNRLVGPGVALLSRLRGKVHVLQVYEGSHSSLGARMRGRE